MKQIKLKFKFALPSKSKLLIIYEKSLIFKNYFYYFVNFIKPASHNTLLNFFAIVAELSPHYCDSQISLIGILKLN